MSSTQVAGKALLKYYKASAGAPGVSLGLTVGKPYIAFLRPVSTSADFVNSADVELLTTWRNRFTNSFLTEFEATPAQTANWLINQVGPDDSRILFMVDDTSGRTFGYMGIAFISWDLNYVEADAVVRGGPAPAGTMSAALKTLLLWSVTHLGLNDVHVRVRSDNPALEFYRKLGFELLKRVPLRRTMEDRHVAWVEDPLVSDSPVSLVYMKLDSQKLL